MILHIPHSRKEIPDEFLKYFLLSPEDLKHELLKMTDHFTDELFQTLSGEDIRLVFPVSRLLVDPERFVEDRDEPMSERGMGCVYEKTHDGRPLKNSQDIRRILIDRYYIPHHERLLTLVNQSMKRSGNALIIDCHSFPKLPLPYEIDQTENRPEICIGIDEFHTPSELIEQIVSQFSKEGFTVEINRPFSGSIVPVEHYQSSRNVHSVMIEVRRDLYMDEETGMKTTQFDETKRKIIQVLDDLRNF